MTRRQRHEAAMYELGKVAGRATATGNTLRIYGEINSITRKCAIQGQWVSNTQLQGRITDEEMDLVLKRLNQCFDESNDYTHEFLRTRQGFLIAGFCTLFTSYIFWLPVAVHKYPKLARLQRQAYAQANEVCDELNKKMLKGRGLKMSISEQGIGEQGIQLPVLQFEFRGNACGADAMDIKKSDNIPVAALVP